MKILKTFTTDRVTQRRELTPKTMWRNVELRHINNEPAGEAGRAGSQICFDFKVLKPISENIM